MKPGWGFIWNSSVPLDSYGERGKEKKQAKERKKGPFWEDENQKR
jgi:hypothetical protein